MRQEFPHPIEFFIKVQYSAFSPSDGDMDLLFLKKKKLIHLLKYNLPIFGTIIFGYLCAISGLLGKKATSVLSDFVFFLAIPSMLLFQFLNAPLSKLFNFSFMAVFAISTAVIGILTVLIVKKFFPQRRAELGIAFMTVAQVNVTYLAIPIFSLFFKTVAPVIMVLIFQTIAFTPIVLAMVEYDFYMSRSGKKKHPSVAKKLFLKEFPKIILKTPIIPASFIGITFAYYDLKFPDTVVTLFSWIGDTAPPLSLFTLGLSLAQDKISFQKGSFRREVLTLIVLKNFILPATAFCLGKYVFDLPPFWLLTTTLIAAMPAPRNASLFAHRYGLDVKKANTLIVLTTLMSFVVINVLMVLFK